MAAQEDFSSPLRAPLALLCGAAIVIYTQAVVVPHHVGASALLGYAAGVAMFVAGLWWHSDTALLVWSPDARRVLDESATGNDQTSADRLVIRWPMFVVAVGLGALTFWLSGGNRFTVANLTTCIASVILAVAACWTRGNEEHAVARPSTPARLRVALLTVFALGAFVLFFRIDAVPRQMTSDHAEKLLDVNDVLHGQYHIYFPRNGGREPMQFYLIAAMTPLTGISYLTMKLGTALVAFFTLPFTYLLARRFFDAPLAVWTTSLLASMRWLWQVGRVGLRFPFPPAFGSAIAWLLVSGLRFRKRTHFLLCGIALGLAQYTYTSLRLAPLVVALCIGVAIAIDIRNRVPRVRIKRLLVDSALLFTTAALVCVPIARFAWDDPRTFSSRTLSRVAFDVQPSLTGLVSAFLLNTRNALLMFNWTADHVWVNTIAGLPAVDSLSGALFLLGCAYVVYRLVRFREWPYLYAIVLFAGGLLPSIMTLAFPQENPSTVRTGAAMPIVAMLIAIPPYLVARSARAWFGGVSGRAAGAILLTATFATAFLINFDQYFRVYAARHERSSQHTYEVAQVVNSFLADGGRQGDVYVLPGAYWMDRRLVAIQTGHVEWDPLTALTAIPESDGVGRKRLVIVKPDDTTSLETLSRWYPSAGYRSHVVDPSGGEPWFVTVVIPPNTRAQS
jgi:hypothetical protein